MGAEYQELHLHSMWSALDSTIKIKDLVKRTKELGMPAVAVTDHGVVAAAIQLYEACEEEKTKAIIGTEAYVSPTDDHALRERIDGYPNYYHLTLLAMNAEGVSQLYQLTSIGFLEGYYYKPRISIKLIEEIGKDLIVMTACLRGPLSWNIMNGNPERASDILARLKDSFSGRLYIEIMDHGIEEQKTINPLLIDLSKQMDVPCLATNDVHFLRREHKYLHDLLMCSQLKKKLHELEESGMKYSEECYLKSPEEMVTLHGESLCRRTLEVAERIDTKLELNIPKFPVYTEEE